MGLTAAWYSRNRSTLVSVSTARKITLMAEASHAVNEGQTVAVGSCVGCGVELPPKRPHGPQARWCSGGCRSRNYRERRYGAELARTEGMSGMELLMERRLDSLPIGGSS